MNGSPAPASSLATLHACFDIAPDAMLAIDQRGRILFANTRAGSLFGYGDSRLQDVPLERLLPGALRDTPAGQSLQHLAAARDVGVDLIGMTRACQSFPVEIELSLVSLDDDVVAIVALRDISETPRAREALERARYDTFIVRISRLVLESPDYESATRQIPQLVATALEVPAVAILSSGRNRDMFQIRAATGLSAATADALSSIFGNGGFVHHAFDGENRDPVTSEARHNEVSVAICTGLAHTRYQYFALAPLFGRYEPLGVLMALAPAAGTFDRDKVAFLQSVANLLTATVQRSHAEEQLAHAQRLEAVGQLTGGIAHDFNNLLTVVSGNLQLLDGELPERPQVREIIDGALRAVDRGAKLTRKLLTFARRQSLAPRAVRPGSLLEDLGQMLKRTLGESIAIQIECPIDVPAVYADPSELDTALVNLALNARDAMPRGGRLNITARNVVIETVDQERNLPPGRYVAFEVGDTGTGMPEDVRARAVEPFFTTKGTEKGSGLGLSMVYGFVTQSGGCMTVDSKLGYGTRVEFFLPAAANESPDAVEHAVVKSHDKRGTVLVVEDEAEVRNIAAAFLRDEGFEVLTTGAASEALQVLATQPHIDLLFSDVVLGGSMTGVELAQEARRLYPRLAVLLVSGYPGAASGAQGTDTTAMFPLLHKPYRREQLASAVRGALDGA